MTVVQVVVSTLLMPWMHQKGQPRKNWKIWKLLWRKDISVEIQLKITTMAGFMYGGRQGVVIISNLNTTILALVSKEVEF